MENPDKDIPAVAATLPQSRSYLKCPPAPPSPPASTPRGFQYAPDSGAQAPPRASQRREDFERWLLSARLEEEKKEAEGRKGRAGPAGAKRLSVALFLPFPLLLPVALHAPTLLAQLLAPRLPSGRTHLLPTVLSPAQRRKPLPCTESLSIAKTRCTIQHRQSSSLVANPSPCIRGH